MINTGIQGPVIAFVLLYSSLPAQVMIEDAFPNISSFSRPVDLQHAGDGTNRLFVVEQSGRIHVFDNFSEVSQRELFLDIGDVVRDGGEEGLLGLTFHPDYENNGYFFVDYTATNPQGIPTNSRTVIARFKVDGSNPNRADRDSMVVVLEVNQPFGNHNAGQIAFGPDSLLYIALGDGGSGGDPDNNGQTRQTLLGAILRIDVDNPAAGAEYGIPEDNPFVGNAQGFREEIYAYGLRNPWRFSFDPVTGWLWAGDVGQSTREEIDIITKGGNYGWRIMEGFLCYNPSSGCNTSGLELPIWDYGRTLGQTVTGGHVYRGSAVPNLIGLYIYGDFGSGRIWALSYDGNNSVENMELMNSNLSISSFGTDQAGELYICAFDGRIYRFKETVTEMTETTELPQSFRLDQNYPNPFNWNRQPSTSIDYVLPAPGNVQVRLYNLQGRLVDNIKVGIRPPGKHTIPWDGFGTDNVPLANGVYYYRLVVDDVVRQSRQLILIK